jgi:hypothetical protein
MNHSSSDRDLFRSCRILFGTELHCSPEFLDYLQIGGVKSAFRRRAMETHPDRLAFGEHDGLPRDADRFLLVRQAYEDLLGYLRSKERPLVVADGAPPRPAHRPATRRPRPIRPIVLPDEPPGRSSFSSTASYYQGELPDRVLLFGHFLYYCGLATWRTIARVLTWQRTERPRLGELGQRYGYFDSEDIALVLRHRLPFSPFGETACRLGLLTPRQVELLVARQQRLQKKFGTILLEKNLLKDYELQLLLQRFDDHNETVARRTRN